MEDESAIEQMDANELERVASAAWDSGQFKSASLTYKRLSCLRPDDRGIAFRLANSLASIGQMAEADSIFQQALLHRPDDFWMGYHWALKSHGAGNLDRAELIAFRLVTRFPEQSGPYWLLGDIATRRHNMKEAKEFFKLAHQRSPGNDALKDFADKASLYERLTCGWESPPLWPGKQPVSADYELLFINMDTSRNRRLTIEERYRNCQVPMRRLPGVMGAQLPMSVAQALTRQPHGSIKRGTLGCTLSHIAAWEYVVTQGLRQCLVIEDDAFPLIRVPSQMAALNIPDDFDICFVQESTEPILSPDARNSTTSFVAYPLAAAWHTFPRDFNAPRTTGYVVSIQGAKRLLEYFARDGAAGDVDWRMISYSVSSPRDLPEASVGAAVARDIHKWLKPFDRLTTYSLYPCILKEAAVDWPRLEMDRETHPGLQEKV